MHFEPKRVISITLTVWPIWYVRAVMISLAFLIGVGLARQAQGANIGYTEIEPILKSRCTVCHSGDSPPVGLHLDSLAGVLKGSMRGAIVKAGKPQDSELIRRLKGAAQPRMPMTGPPYLTDEQIALFEAWIKQGLAESSVSLVPRVASVGGR